MIVWKQSVVKIWHISPTSFNNVNKMGSFCLHCYNLGGKSFIPFKLPTINTQN